MSTRCTIHFHDTYRKDVPAAIVYRHSDGYPEGFHGVIESLDRFFDDVAAATADTRFGDPCYLAAKYVIWQATQYAHLVAKEENVVWRLLDTVGVGVCQEDPGDIVYRYHVRCHVDTWPNKDVRPDVTFEEA